MTKTETEKPSVRKTVKSIASKLAPQIEDDLSSEDDITKSTRTSKTKKSVTASGHVVPSPRDGLAEATLEQLLLENSTLKEQIKEQKETILELKNAVKDLTEMIKSIKECGNFSARPHGKEAVEPGSGKVLTSGADKKKKVSFAAIMKNEEQKYAVKRTENLEKRGVRGVRAHSPDGKFYDKDNRSSERQSILIKEIKDSKWTGNELLYLVLSKEGNETWISSKECSQAEKLISEFHEANPDAASPSDYVAANEWKSVRRKEKTIQGKLKTKKALSAKEIDFIAFNLTSAPTEARKFTRVHLRITNKRALANCSYAQKLRLIRNVIHSYGLSAHVMRISFIGASVLEIYVHADSQDRFCSGMRSHGWDFIEDFDFYDTKSFDGKTQSQEETERCLDALVQRLAFLSASTQLKNLQECILAGLKEETQTRILKRREEIIESRAGERTAYVQKSQ
jgi:uncharacterized protein YoxC